MKHLKSIILGIIIILLGFFVMNENKGKSEIKKEVVTSKPIEEKNSQKEVKEEKTSQVKILEKGLKILSIDTESNEISTVEISLSDEIDYDKDISAYIRFENLNDTKIIDYDILRLANKIVISGRFNIEDSYNLTILKGLKSKNGDILIEDYNREVDFKELKPRLVFSNDGIILPSINNKKIAFKSLNIKKINLELRKVYENNTTQFLQDFAFKGNGNLDSYRVQSSLSKVGGVIFEKEYDLDYIKNKWSQTEINLGNIIDTKGIYLVNLYFNEEDMDYEFPATAKPWEKYSFLEDSSKISKAILVSDVGITSQKSKDGYVVNLRNILNNENIKNANIQGISYNNQVLFEGQTDENGEVKFKVDKEIFYIIAKYKDEASILKFKDSELSYDGFLVGGSILEEGIKTFIYLDRGVYRPGDEINLSIIARNENMSFPENHPININIYSPTGKKYIENIVVKDGKNGMYAHSFKTQADSQTGLWIGEVLVGNKGYKIEIPVETIVPNTIEVEVESPLEVDINKEKEIKVSLEARYLFGGSGGNLKYKSEISFKENIPYFEKYKSYSFYNPTDYEFSYLDSKEGSLNEEGRVDLSFDVLKLFPKNINLIGEIKSEVKEGSGRPVKRKTYVDINKFSTIIGIEKPSERYIKSGDSLNLRAIVVSSDGEKLIPNKKMKFRVYKNEYSWWWDYVSHSSFIKSIKTDVNTKLIHEEEFTSKEEPSLINYRLEGSGEVFVEVIDTETNQSSGINLYVDTWTDSKLNKKIDKLKIQSDKKIYNLDEIAKITYEGSKNSLAQITIEKSGKIINRYVKKINEIKNIEEIKITKEMFPNAYVNISLYQDYESLENNRPLRLYGAVPLNVDDNSTKLQIQVDSPKEVRPNEEVVIKIKNTSETKMSYTLAVVDEGLLGLTNFKSPNPWEFFYEKQGMQIKTYDNYNEIMGKIFGEINQVLTTGGGFGSDNFLSAKALNREEYRKKEEGENTAKRFKPVVFFKGVLETDDRGQGEVRFKVPSYMGALRVMVVGASDENFGSQETKILVKAPVIPLINLPRNLKLGDEIKVLVEVFGLEDEVGEVSLSLDFNKETQTKKINILKDEKKNVEFNLKSPDNIGKYLVKTKLESLKYNYQQEVEIDVVTNQTYTYLNELDVIKKDELKEYIIPKNSLNSKGRLLISSSPILGLDKRLASLIRYPYGCAEQTVSKLFAQLYIKDLATEGSYNEEEVIENINIGIGKLMNYQLYNGGFSYWPRETKEDLWVSTYIGHFLVEAKNKGYYIPSEVYENWKKFSLKEIIKKDRDVNLKVYTLYVMSLANEIEISETNLIYENYLDKLLLTSKWYLGSIYEMMGNREVAQDITKNLSISNEVLDEKIRQEFYMVSYGSSLKDKSIILDSYYKIYGEINEELYTEILSELQSEKWLSTQGVASSLMSIAKIKEENSKAEISGSLEINGETKAYETSDGKYILDLEDNMEIIKIDNKNEADIFSHLYWEGLPLDFEKENISKNLRLRRNFYDDKGKEIDVKSLDKGKTFWLEIEVMPEKENMDYFYIENLALTQILPSGWEVENLRLQKEAYPKWIKNKGSYDYLDIRDDRVMWFFNYDNYKNRAEKFYIKLNTVTSGKFKMSGTKVEAMYNPNYEAYLRGYGVEVK